MHPGEVLGDSKPLVGAEHGAFVYVKPGSKHFYYYALLPSGMPIPTSFEGDETDEIANQEANALNKSLKAAGAGLRSLTASLIKDSTEIVWDIRKGEDGLSAVVKVVSKKDKRVDKVLHCCNGVGFKWADKHRLPLLLFASLIGVGIGACGVCGALGLHIPTMISLPWGEARAVPFTGAFLSWWGCGSYPSTSAECSDFNAKLEAAWTSLWLKGEYNVSSISFGTIFMNVNGMCVLSHPSLAKNEGDFIPKAVIDLIALQGYDYSNTFPDTGMTCRSFSEMGDGGMLKDRGEMEVSSCDHGSRRVVSSTHPSHRLRVYARALAVLCVWTVP